MNDWKEIKPGFFLRMFLKNTPIPSLIRHYLAYQGGDSFHLLEDHQFPRPLSLFLTERGMLDNDESFFLKDRSKVRSAVIVESGADLLSDPSSNTRIREMIKSIEMWLHASGKKIGSFKMFTFDSLNIKHSIFKDETPYILILWSPERSTLEEALGGEINSIIPDTNSKDNEGSIVSEETLDDVPVVTLQSNNDLPAEGVLSSNWERWQHLRYRVVGSGRGLMYRKLYIVLGENRMKLAFLSSRDELPEHYVLGFFDRIRSSSNCVTAHGDIMANSPVPDGIFSFTCEIDGSGSLNALNYGVFPVVWRKAKQRLMSIPNTVISDLQLSAPATGPYKRGRAKSIHRAKAKLNSGDYLVLFPSSLSEGEKGVLAEMLKKTPEALVAGELGRWLDENFKERSLLLTVVD